MEVVGTQLKLQNKRFATFCKSLNGVLTSAETRESRTTLYMTTILRFPDALCTQA